MPDPAIAPATDAPATDAPARPDRPGWFRLTLVAAPALLIAVLGSLHPIFLTPDTADRWQLAHLLLLPAFPLLAVSIWLLMSGERGALAWAARVLALAYAVLYGALDAIAGVGAPQQVLGAARRGEPNPPINDLYEIGDQLGRLGVVALFAAGALTAVVLLQRRRSAVPVLAVAVLAGGCWIFAQNHVFPTRGVLGMLTIGLALGLLGLAREQARASRLS